MTYVLVRVSGGPRAYVAPPGSRKSYTTDLRKARRFPTLTAAEADVCGNERPVRYEEA